MDDSPAKLKIIPGHFQVPTSSIESPESRTSSITEPGTDRSSRYCFLVKRGIEESNNKNIIKRLYVRLNFEISNSI